MLYANLTHYPDFVFRTGRLPCVHHIDERPHRNSTNHPRNGVVVSIQLRPKAHRNNERWVHHPLKTVLCVGADRMPQSRDAQRLVPAKQTLPTVNFGSTPVGQSCCESSCRRRGLLIDFRYFFVYAGPTRRL
jgi:hypothetical protein